MLHRPTHREQFHWTDEAIATLRKLWMEGLSGSEIAERLGFGVTRNSVIGKVHRLKIERTTGPKRRTRAEILADARANKPQPKPQPKHPHANKGAPKAAAIRHRAAVAVLKPPMVLPIPDDLPDVTDRIGLMDLGRADCRWCSGDPMTADHSFCGKPVRPGSMWCEAHHRRVYPASAPLI